MAQPIGSTQIESGENLMKIVEMKRDLQHMINSWLENPSKEVQEGLEVLNTYFGSNTAELMATSAMNILLAQKSLTEYHRGEGVEGV